MTTLSPLPTITAQPGQPRNPAASCCSGPAWRDSRDCWETSGVVGRLRFALRGTRQSAPIGRRGDLCITRKVWEGNLKDPKTQKRQAPVPVIPHLQKAFDAYWKAAGSPAEGWIFTASRGKLPIRMDNLAGREIKPDLKKAGLGWHGWHAFRRGLATNLRELGIPDDVIQRILRHSDIGTTQRFYAKTLTKTVRKAMAKLDRQLIRDKSGTATELSS